MESGAQAAPGGPGLKQCQIKLEEQQRVKGSAEDKSSAEESGVGSRESAGR